MAGAGVAQVPSPGISVSLGFLNLFPSCHPSRSSLKPRSIDSRVGSRASASAAQRKRWWQDSLDVYYREVSTLKSQIITVRPGVGNFKGVATHIGDQLR